MAHAFLWDYMDKRLKLAQLLGQLGVFLTRLLRQQCRARERLADTLGVLERRKTAGRRARAQPLLRARFAQLRRGHVVASSQPYQFETGLQHKNLIVSKQNFPWFKPRQFCVLGHDQNFWCDRAGLTGMRSGWSIAGRTGWCCVESVAAADGLGCGSTRAGGALEAVALRRSMR